MNVPPMAKVIELMALGYPAVAQPPRTREPLEKVVCYDKFI
jgi:hypothetical protein